MSAAGTVAAVDLGATSGRVILGRVDGRGAGALEIRQVARFANEPVRLASGLHWDLTGLYRSVTTGLAQAIRESPEVASIGVDSWAVDYALLRGERVLGEPFHYRDERTTAAVDTVHAVVPFAELYRRNGLQFLPFNTLYQLAAERAIRADASTSPTRSCSSPTSSDSSSPGERWPSARTRRRRAPRRRVARVG